MAGILSLGGAPPERAELVRMSRALAHRGPDGEGHAVLGPCGLAHRRLAIIDLSPAGKQPMTIDGERYWLVYNGEVYNYVELRAELEALGHRFRSRTDSEVILHAYARWGDAAFSRFNGMWGLAIWDQAERKLILSRDRAGVKPLYLHTSPRRVMFASEIKALLAADPSLAQLDRRSVARLLERPSLLDGKPTFFAGVESVEPGTVLEIAADGKTACRRFWRFLPPSHPIAIDEDEAAERVREVLIDAVRIRFRSDVPVGTCLSGGIDSSSIVAIAARKLDCAPETFSAVYDEPEFAEGEFVELMQRDFALRSHTVSPDGGDMAEVIERATYFQEQPAGGPGIYSQWHVMKSAAGKVKVLLDGQGGDELFAGYFWFFGPQVRSLLAHAARGDVGALLEVARSRGPIRELTGTDPLAELARRARQKIERRLGLSRGREGPVETPLLTHEMRALLDPERPSWGIPPVSGDALADALWDTVVRTSLPQLLRYEDRDSMAFSIEARTPFLDYRLIELAFRLPNRTKLRGATTKAVLRDAMQDILPDRIRLRRDKKGYPTPFALWLRRGHEAWLRDLVLSPRARARRFTDPTAVDRLIADHVSGRRDHAARLFALATLELFCLRFLDAPFTADPPPPGAVIEDGDAVPVS